jgi:pimeloyl-ACP methyl ester carboxylesterase
VAFTQNQGAKIYWDEQGQGPPVLLIMGLGWTSVMWYRTRPVLAARYRTVAFDNRGVGRSDVPPGPYSIALMASDAAAVLDAAGIQRAHIFGVSMGGMIAQEFVLQYPERVDALILGCTAAGGPRAVQADSEVLLALFRRGLTPDEYAQITNPFIYHASTPHERIEEDMVLRKKWYPTEVGYLGQLQAIMSWEAYTRLAKIAAPTLVMHGETDRLIPAANSALIAERIPGAKLVVIPKASHVFATDQPQAANQAIMEFLQTQDPRE